ncbi:MAG: YciI family protein [Acidobacteria bacterium]|nr:YciI family protein [Acidobacteriota bacterium]
MKPSKIIPLSLFLIAMIVVVHAQSKPEDKMPQFDLDNYQFGILKRGPNSTAEKTPESQKIQEGHMANINKMARAGKLIAAGPMAGNGEIRGIFIFKVASLEEAKSLAAEDPAVQSGRLVIELLNWHGPKGIGAKLQEEIKTNPNPKYTMTRYFLALLKRGPKSSAATTPETQKLQLDHLWNVRRMMDAKTFVAAGPFVSQGDLRGIFVIAANSPEEARAIAEADPAVKAGQLAAEIHPWFVAREVWP